MLNKFARVWLVIIIGIMGISVAVEAATSLPSTPKTMTFQATLSSKRTGPIQGRKDVKFSIYDGRIPRWQEEIKNIQFVNGTFSAILGLKIPLSETVFAITSANLAIQLKDPGTSPATYTDSVVFPLSSAPYAIQARIADKVRSVDASRIVGAFTSTVNITRDLLVGTGILYVGGQNRNVGIGTTRPNALYKLDVAGIVNAQGFRIGNEDLETLFTWKKKDANLYYSDGFVGVGTANPRYELDIVGTVNATEYRINGIALDQYLRDSLAWKNRSGRDIYFDDGTVPNNIGKVGIGTANPTERLDVRGAIRIAASDSLTPLPGVIQYKDGDFQGYTVQGWQSLTGLQGTGAQNQLAYWTGTKTVAGTSKMVWVNERLGIGTTDPQARLDIRTDSTTPLRPVLDIRNADNASMFFVGATGKVGIGTTEPSQALEVKGVVDAQYYRINGRPLDQVISKDSYWLRENNGRIFYDKGNVGIGTNQPRNLLEIASATRNPAITFDIAGVNLFTMGVPIQNPNAFIISRGGDLNVPVFTFQGENIGVGTSHPSANFFVSGNSGVVFSGTFGSTESLLETGTGTKLIWYPAKAAFRVGRVLNDEWNQANLGLYSIGMGFNPTATGEGSVVGGGYKNTASGKNAVVPGGIENVASGEGSFAAGHSARAIHKGSFVWADYTVPTSSFISAADNQFVIRAHNGVGVGTSNTTASAFTVAREGDGYIFRSYGSRGIPAVIVTTSGNVGIGTTDPGSAGLAVMNGTVGIGTTEPQGLLTIQNKPGERSPLVAIFPYVAGRPATPTAALYITASGNVGVGVTSGQVFGDTKFLVRGAIQATRFLQVDPNDPNKTIVIQPGAGSPWLVNNQTGHIYRNQGLVGIGTTTPLTLLTLSNNNPSRNIPAIAFDIDGRIKYEIGVTPNVRGDYVFGVFSGSRLSTTPSITVATRSVGIGIGLNVPRATLDVSGNVMVSRNLLVATTNASNLYRVQVGGGLNTERLYIQGVQFIPSPENPWRTNGSNLFYNGGNVGIGVTNPVYKLVVNGVVSVNSLIVSKPISLTGDLISNRLLLQDVANTIPPTYGEFKVVNGEFVYTRPDGISRTISSPLQRGTGTTGELAYWVDNTSLGRTALIWDNSVSTLIVSGNMQLTKVRKSEEFRVTANGSWGGDVPFNMQSTIAHDGNLTNVKGYTAEKIGVTIDKNWGNINNQVQVKGLEVKLQSKVGTVLLNNATAVGLVVNVSSVNVQESSRGQKYAAIFRGGNVGIGTTTPRAELEVAGTVSANYFNLSGGLSVPQLTVNGSSFVARFKDTNGRRLPRVGIGISNPETRDAELEVSGTVSSNALVVSGGIQTTTANIGNNSFVIDSAGNIGIGTSAPSGQIDIKRIISSAITDDVVSQKISVDIDGAAPGNIFYLNKNLTGMDITLKSVLDNRLGANATGIKVDLSNLRLNSSRAVGLDINVTGNTGTRYAAIFRGGKVGIGTTTPAYDLDIVGTINARNLILRGNLQSTRATFNYLVINRAATFNGRVTINSLVVQGVITANTLVLRSTLEAPNGKFSTLNATTASFNRLVKAKTVSVNQTLSARTGLFSRSVSIGGAPMPISGLAVSGNVVADTIEAKNLLLLTGATLNVTNGITPFLFTNSSGKVGIGTSRPDTQLHVLTTAAADYRADVSSWAQLRIQAKSNAQNVGAGLLLVPDGVVASRSVGSAIVAIRASDAANQSGSHLVFITDPSAGLPQERMRITDSGDVGIGTTSPLAKLDVNGTMRVSGNVIVDGSFSLTQLSSIAGLTISPNGMVTIESPVSVNATFRVGKSLLFKPGATPVTNLSFGQVYVNQTDNNLYYLRPNSSVPINLTSTITGLPNRVPFVDSSGNLSSTAAMFWNNQTKTFTVGTRNTLAGVEVLSTINNTVTGTLALQQIQMGFQDRSTLPSPQTSVFTGLDIELSGQNPNDLASFGRIAQGETAIGLKVDVRGLRAKQFNQGGAVTQGSKAAAVFLGGSVGIGTDTPLAALHIANNVTGNVLQIDAGSISNILTIPLNGNVGVGLSNPTSKLTVKADTSDSTKAALNIVNSDSRSIFFVRNDGKIGVGTTLPSSNFHVVGTVSANTTTFGSITATTLNIGAGKLFVNRAGQVGVGTTTPTGTLTFDRSFDVTNAPVTDITSQKIQVKVGNNQENTQFFFTKNITGLDVSMQSVGNALLGGGIAAAKATYTGVSVNMTGTRLGPNSRLVGLKVDVTPALNSVGTRYAAVFLGGNVGVGVTDPTVALDVSGDIKADSLILSGAIQTSSVTVNRLYVTNVASFNGTVSINRLIANSLVANILRVSGNLTVATASFTTVNATQAVVSRRLGVGILGRPQTELDVSGNATITRRLVVGETLFANSITGTTVTINVTQNMTVNGSVSINNTLKVGVGVVLKKQTSTPAKNDLQGQLFVDSAGQLNYLKPASVAGIRLSTSGTAGRIPFFDNTQNLSASANLSWNSTTNKLTVGTGNMDIVSDFPISAVGDLYAQRIAMSFGNRTGVVASKFTGLNIVLSGQNPADPILFGRVGAGEEAVGLKVDVSDLHARYSLDTPLPEDATYSGYKYAAAFMGGNVGIGTETPRAALHVVNAAVGNTVFRVDTLSTQNALVVNGASYVGIGTATPDARLTIRAKNQVTGGAFNIYKANQSLLYVENSGRVGVFTRLPSANLHIKQSSATTAGLRVETIAIANALLVSSNGLVGIGVSAPTANLQIRSAAGVAPLKVSASNANENALVVNSDGFVGMGIAAPAYPLSVNGLIISGTTETPSVLPSWISNSQSTRGFLVNNKTESTFFGLRKRDNETTLDSTIWWNSLPTHNFRVEYYNGTATTNVMSFHSSGKVLISNADAIPSASLHIISAANTNPLLIQKSDLTTALIVSRNGWVGIGTSAPSANLHVLGSIMANTIEVLNDSIQVSTLNVTKALIVNRNMSNGKVATAQAIELTLGADTNQDITGLSIKVDAAPNTLLPARKNAIYGGAYAVGLKVDVSGIEIRDPILASRPGYKIAAVFTGGDVGIGSSSLFKPAYPFHVEVPLNTDVATGQTFTDVARFGTSGEGSVTLRDFGSARYGFYTRSEALGVSYLSLAMAASSENAGVGRVGIGTSSPDLHLVVNGDMRLGVVKNSTVTVGAGYGNALYFSGGPDLSATLDTENGTPLFMRRLNKTAGISELRVEVGNGNSANQYAVGYSTTPAAADYKPIFQVMASGKVGVNDTSTGVGTFTPSTTFHVKGSTVGAEDRLSSHMVAIENLGGQGADTLAIYNHNAAANNNSTFVSFFSDATLAGAIQANPDGSGVRYMTQGADYAEYLPKANPTELIEKGDIVGLINGKVSKNTNGAQQVMVKSAAASVAGNWPGEKNKDAYSLTAFFGQVPVKVVGPVKKGDFIIPSNRLDGTGVAVHADKLKPEQYAMIVGTAWADSDSEGVKLIHTAVGFSFSIPNMNAQLSQLDKTTQNIEALKFENDQIKKDFDAKLTKQNEQIQNLLKALENK